VSVLATWRYNKKWVIVPNMHTFNHSEFTTYGLLLCMSMMLAIPAHSQTSQRNDDLPILYGIKLDGSRIAIDVASSGCTDASYFSVQLDPASPDTYRLSVIQNKKDRCRMSVHVVTLTLDIPAVPNLVGARFVLINRLVAPVGLLRSDP